MNAAAEQVSVGAAGGHMSGRTSPSGRAHFPALDGCRALAATGVFLTHLTLLSGFATRNTTLGPYLARMDVGVSVFFVLSGFLLYRPIVAARLEGRSDRDTATYARRRLLRIFPAYWVALTIVAFVLRAPGFEEPHSIVAHYLLIHVYDGSQLVGGPIQQSWSLATELAFYAFIPLWAYLLGRRRREPRAQLVVELVGLGMLFAASGLANLVLVMLDVQGSTFAQLGTWLPFRLTDFVPGMALAVVSAWLSQHRIELPAWTRGARLTLGCWSVALVAFWVVSTRFGLPAFPTFTTRQAFVVRVLYLVVAFFGVLPAVLGRQRGGLVQQILANRVAVWVGLVSYGIYIWHEAWMDLYLRWFDRQVLATGTIAMGAFTVIMTVTCAAASWYIVEKPAMSWGRRVF